MRNCGDGAIGWRIVIKSLSLISGADRAQRRRPGEDAGTGFLAQRPSSEACRVGRRSVVTQPEIYYETTRKNEAVDRRVRAGAVSFVE